MGELTNDFAERLCRAHYTVARAVAYRTAGARAHKVDPSAAAEEAIIRVARRHRTAADQSPEQVRLYLLTAVENQIRDELRRAEVRTGGFGSSGPTVAAPDGDPAQLAERADEIRRVWAALKVLAHNDRQVLVLYHLSGKSSGEVAQMLGVSKAALRQRVHRAQEALGRVLLGRHARSHES